MCNILERIDPFYCVDVNQRLMTMQNYWKCWGNIIRCDKIPVIGVDLSDHVYHHGNDDFEIYIKLRTNLPVTEQFLLYVTCPFAVDGEGFTPDQYTAGRPYMVTKGGDECSLSLTLFKVVDDTNGKLDIRDALAVSEAVHDRTVEPLAIIKRRLNERASSFVSQYGIKAAFVLPSTDLVQREVDSLYSDAESCTCNDLDRVKLVQSLRTLVRECTGLQLGA